jgi:V-type H+-transporting ATPase subunit A
VEIGDPVKRTGKQFCVELGPGLLGSLFDGLQRPLQKIEEAATDKTYIEKGIKIPALDRTKLWEFQPVNFEVGDQINSGDIFGEVQETTLLVHYIMLPPKEQGTITWIASAGKYKITDPVLEVVFRNKRKKFSMLQEWPGTITSQSCYN